MSTGDLEGLHSSGKGLGMEGADEEKDSALALENVPTKELQSLERKKTKCPIIHSITGRR